MQAQDILQHVLMLMPGQSSSMINHNHFEVETTRLQNGESYGYTKLLNTAEMLYSDI